jgi:hypothetical protein
MKKTINIKTNIITTPSADSVQIFKSYVNRHWLKKLEIALSPFGGGRFGYIINFCQIGGGKHILLGLFG